MQRFRFTRPKDRGLRSGGRSSRRFVPDLVRDDAVLPLRITPAVDVVTVATGDGPGSFANVVDTAGYGDFITFAPGITTCYVDQAADLTAGNVFIDGQGCGTNGNNEVLLATNGNQILDVNPGFEQGFYLQGLTFAGGTAPAGQSGGAVDFNGNESYGFVQQCNFGADPAYPCLPGNSGGSIYVGGYDLGLNMMQTGFYNNSSCAYGDVQFATAASGNLNLTGFQVVDDSGTANAGPSFLNIEAQVGGNYVVQGGLIANTANGYAITYSFQQPYGFANLFAGELYFNSVDGAFSSTSYGQQESGQLELVGTTIAGSTNPGGAVVLASAGNNSLIGDNITGSVGGGIIADLDAQGTFDLVADTTVSYSSNINNMGGYGGGISVFVDQNDNSFGGNSLQAVNDTLFDDQALYGGGLAFVDTAPQWMQSPFVAVTSDTLVSDVGYDDGGGIWANSPPANPWGPANPAVAIDNTIATLNLTFTPGAAPNISGPVFMGYSLEGDTTGTTIVSNPYLPSGNNILGLNYDGLQAPSVQPTSPGASVYGAPLGLVLVPMPYAPGNGTGDPMVAGEGGVYAQDELLNNRDVDDMGAVIAVGAVIPVGPIGPIHPIVGAPVSADVVTLASTQTGSTGGLVSTPSTAGVDALFSALDDSGPIALSLPAQGLLDKVDDLLD